MDATNKRMPAHSPGSSSQWSLTTSEVLFRPQISLGQNPLMKSVYFRKVAIHTQEGSENSPPTSNVLGMGSSPVIFVEKANQVLRHFDDPRMHHKLKGYTQKCTLADPSEVAQSQQTPGKLQTTGVQTTQPLPATHTKRRYPNTADRYHELQSPLPARWDTPSHRPPQEKPTNGQRPAIKTFCVPFPNEKPGMQEIQSNSFACLSTT